MGAVLAAVAMTTGGLALPALTLSGSLEALQEAFDYWGPTSFNGSLAGLLARVGIGSGPLVATAVLVPLMFGLLRRCRDLHQSLSVATAFAIILSPLSWPNYSLAALPAAMGAWKSRRSRWLLVPAAAVLATQIVGSWVLLGRFLLVSALFLWVSDPTTLPAGPVDYPSDPVNGRDGLLDEH